MYTYGSINRSRARHNCFVVSPTGELFEKAIHLGFRATNNKVEYEGAIYVLQEVKIMGSTKVELFIDSKLMMSQIRGTYEDKNKIMSAYLNVLQTRAYHFTKVEVIIKLRSNLRHVDSLVYMVASLTEKSSQ